MQDGAEKRRQQSTVVRGAAKKTGGDALEDSQRSRAPQAEEDDRIERVQGADGILGAASTFTDELLSA